MDCDQARFLLDAYVDGELDLLHHLEVERHAQTCPVCGPAVANLREGRAVLHRASLRRAAPARLEARIRDALPRSPSVNTTPAPSANAPGAKRIAFPRWLGLAASLALVAASGYTWGERQARTRAVADELIADHVRSLQADHLTDVASTDQHTVKPWFAGKLDFSPPVVDLADTGFPLIGGRLDRVAGHTAAALVYRRRQHAINVFVWPVEKGDASLPADASRNGFNVESWRAGDLVFLAVSEIPATDLAQFAAAFRARSSGNSEMR